MTNQVDTWIYTCDQPFVISVIPPPTIDAEDDDTSNDTGNKKHLEFSK